MVGKSEAKGQLMNIHNTRYLNLTIANVTSNSIGKYGCSVVIENITLTSSIDLNVLGKSKFKKSCPRQGQNFSWDEWRDRPTACRWNFREGGCIFVQKCLHSQTTYDAIVLQKKLGSNTNFSSCEDYLKNYTRFNNTKNTDTSWFLCLNGVTSFRTTCPNFRHVCPPKCPNIQFSQTYHIYTHVCIIL